MPSTVLVANSDKQARGEIAAWLQADGYVSVPVGIGGALRETRQRKPQAVVIAVSRPDDGAMWVVRTLCTQRPQVGVVVITAQPSFEIAEAANRLGVVDCLPGPAAAGEVVDAVRRAMLWRAAVEAASHRDGRSETDVASGRRYLLDTIARVDSQSAQSILLSALEARGDDAHDRTCRVAQSAAALARAHNLSAADTLDVWQAAVLYSLGGIATAAGHSGGATLFGDSAAACQPHKTISLDVLASVPALAAAGRIVAAINERVDGTGHPVGLAGNAIPVGARIVAVADAYDNLTSAQPSGDSVSHDEANARLARSAGTHLDSDIVRAWIGLEDVAQCS